MDGYSPLTDAEWALVYDLAVPPPVVKARNPKGAGRPFANQREVLDGLLRLVTEERRSFRVPPGASPSSVTLRRAYGRWWTSGALAAMTDRLAATRPRLTAALEAFEHGRVRVPYARPAMAAPALNWAFGPVHTRTDDDTEKDDD